jgi:hypothetical protein
MPEGTAQGSFDSVRKYLHEGETMLPNFICPGAARSATTTLYYLLIQHPQIYLPQIKETRFFAIDYDKGLPWYESHYYSKTSDEVAIGDISPAYLVHEKCPERIYNSLGSDVKFIFMLRNPAKRSISHFQMLTRMQIEDLPMDEAFKAGPRREKSLKHFRHEYGFQYLKESCYSQHIERYLQYFPKSNMKFVVFEEFARDVEQQLADISSFLGVQPGFKFDLDLYQNQNFSSDHALLNRIFYRNPISKKLRTMIQMNTSWKTQVLLKKLKNAILSSGKADNQPVQANNDEFERRLDEYFQEEIDRLSNLIDRDLSIWRPSR